MIISAGPTNSSLPRGCSPWLRPGSWRANPDEETTDWRAVCGRTARTVRRAGTAKAVSDPYRVEEGTMWKEIPPFSFSAGERKIMAHFVVRMDLSKSVAKRNGHEKVCAGYDNFQGY